MERHENNLRFNKSRFQIDYGPDSLFKRVHYVFSKKSEKLKQHGKHYNARLLARSIPEEVRTEIAFFDIRKWKLVSSEVRNDTGKFISSTWEKEINGVRYWLVIGLHDTIETIIKKESDGLSNIISGGEIYDFVSNVNSELMKDIES